MVANIRADKQGKDNIRQPSSSNTYLPIVHPALAGADRLKAIFPKKDGGQARKNVLNSDFFIEIVFFAQITDWTATIHHTFPSFFP